MRYYVAFILVVALILFAFIRTAEGVPEPPMLIDEPDATSGVMPSGYNPNAATRMYNVPCVINPQTWPIVNPIRKT